MASIELQVLTRKQLWGVAYAADMLMLQFGMARELPARTGGNRKVGEYALHVQCPSTLDVQGASVQPLADFITTAAPVTVLAIEQGASGSLSIHLDPTATLRIVSDPTSDREQWRLLRPGRDEPHLVFRAGRVAQE